MDAVYYVCTYAHFEKPPSIKLLRRYAVLRPLTFNFTLTRTLQIKLGRIHTKVGSVI